jgi:hypothetical protein
MAVGAKLFLCAPEARAGDVGLILLTLAILQLYEVAVSTVLIVLHRSGRSPEDRPSLLLVAALFWTGPLAATLEVIEHDRATGLGFAAAAAILAWAELGVVRRATHLRISPAGALVAGLSLLLVAALPLRLHVPHGAPGTDELALYGAWWALALLALFAVPAVRWHTDAARGPHAAPSHVLNTELLFLAITLAAAATHLYAMNYAFFGHARASYAAPLLLALTPVLGEVLARRHIAAPLPRFTLFCLPAAALICAGQGFDRDFPVTQLPPPARDPLTLCLLLAAAAWWLAAARNRVPALLHAGSAALAVAVWRWLPAGVTPPAPLAPDNPLPLPVGLAVYGVALYLVLIAACRRARAELYVALLAHVLGAGLLLYQRGPYAVPAFAGIVGWTWLLACHLAHRPPPLRSLLWPLGVLVVLTCGGLLVRDLRVLAWTHAALLCGTLLALGLRYWPHYRWLAAGVAGLCVACQLAHQLATGRHAQASLAVAAAFLLLAGAAFTSWHKRRLLAPERIRAQSQSGPEVNFPAPDVPTPDSV